MLIKNTIGRALILGFLVLLWILNQVTCCVDSIYNNQNTFKWGRGVVLDEITELLVLINFEVQNCYFSTDKSFVTDIPA